MRTIGSTRTLSRLMMLFGATLAGCGGGTEGTAGAGAAATGGSGGTGQGGSPTTAPGVGGVFTTGSGGGPATTTATTSSGGGGGASCGDTQEDPSNCGACGNACASGQSCDAGKCVCPPYQSFCGGACIPTSVDPKNCGGCGVTCSGTDVCSAGACSSTCLPGLEACNNRCVDLENDNDHCGDCATACGAGKGCVAGKCVDAVVVGPPPAKCGGGSGPPIVLDPSLGGCLGNLAQTTFTWSLCSCNDLNVSAPLSTDAFDSTKGPYAPGEIGGGVGVNRDVTHWSQAVTVGGTLWVAGGGAYKSSGPASTIRGDMHLKGSWNASSPFTVEKDAFATGALTGVKVNGATKTIPDLPAACDCRPESLVPVAEIVAAHRPPNNDNAAIGLNADVFENPGGPLRLDLPCGNYYLTHINTATPLTIAAHGRTALYIDGNVNPTAPIAFVLEPDAELDILIAGTIISSQTVVIGSPNYPALSRTYVGGTESLKFSQDVRIAGQVYAAKSSLVDWSAHNEIYGAVFAGNFKSSQVTKIHYDRGVLVAGHACPPPHGGGSPATTTGTGTGTGGGPTDECGSCKDCGNQACIQGECGACTDSSQCCAPLKCVNGSCEADYIPK